MALIDFRCEKCGNEFFEIVNGNNVKITCSKCGSENVKKVYKGKFYGFNNGGGCSGKSCSGCSGCN